ncbi:MAG: acyltransferase [bacterium]
MSDATPPQLARIPSLDGLRAISIIAVIAGHLVGTRNFPAWTAPVLAAPQLNIAFLGVRVFFVISGFLITGLLCGELERNGRISLSRFYMRRTLRIIPAYLAFVAVIAILVAMGLVVVAPHDFAYALTYTMNYAPSRGWALGHLWSLALEEQFYLIWPLTLVLVGRRWGARTALAVVLIVPFVRVAAMVRNQPVLTFGTMSDALAIGCLAQLWGTHIMETRAGRFVIKAGWAGPLLLALAMVVAANNRRTGWLTFDALTNIACGVFVLHCVYHPHTWLGRLLNVRALVFIGTLSYSLYLWQQLFVDRESTSWPHAFPMNIMLAFLAALASYYAVEQPFLRLRHRWRGSPIVIPATPSTSRETARDT